ncbi:Protein EARLY RESPONSIVE TO DEHYDRATION 15 [Abeliophyllum distichum]|uniref:Protein EARLY RESPONSIVE TO DEHYDRATION 15 n=1 Tax=Abeliophyllum distichum TaxID=126358 RepID=A0ABD1PPY0_9LAMI
MALVSGGRSTLDPYAPLFIPTSVRQVEDFSPEWWNLVTTSTWFRNYWLTEYQGEDIFGVENDVFDGNDVAKLLPDNIDLILDKDTLNMEAQFEEFLLSSEPEYGNKEVKRIPEYGLNENAEVLIENRGVSNERGSKFLGGADKFLGEADRAC